MERPSRNLTTRKWGKRKNTIHEEKLQGQFVDQTMHIANQFSGKWIRNGFKNEEIEDMLVSAEDLALRIQSKQFFQKSTLLITLLHC